MTNNDLLVLIGNFLISTGGMTIGLFVGFIFGVRKYVLEKVYDKKSEEIIDLYKCVVNLDVNLRKYIVTIGADGSEDSLGEKKKALNKIQGDFFKFQRKFWEAEIILDDQTIQKVNKFIEVFININSKLFVANVCQQQRDKWFKGWDDSYKLVSKDLIEIREELKKEFKKTLIK